MKKSCQNIHLQVKSFLNLISSDNSDLYPSQRNSTIYVNRVPVVEADLMATNGVVHAVGVIIKPLRKP